MTQDPDDPVRLLDSADAPAGLRDALNSAKSDIGSDAQVARLAQRLGPILGGAALASGTSGTAGATAASAKGAAASVGALKLGGAALAVMIAAGGAWHYFMTSANPPPASSPASPVVAKSPPVPVVAPSEALAPPSGASAPAVVPLPNKPVSVVPLSEAELLEQARAASKSDPARALARANEHARRFPRGVLVQEREVLAIQALRRLGHSAEAERRAEAFAKAFPGSAFARKLNASP